VVPLSEYTACHALICTDFDHLETWKGRQAGFAPVFFLSGRNLHPGAMHDSEFWKECHLLAPIVGFSHSEKTLVCTNQKFLGWT
jgi:hypothetical protein